MAHEGKCNGTHKPIRKIGFFNEENAVPLETHKVRIVQKLTLKPLEERVQAINTAGYNTFMLQNADVFLGGSSVSCPVAAHAYVAWRRKHGK